MDNSPNDRLFISGIHNYCDRWCERCDFTNRCRVFAIKPDAPHDDCDMGSIVRDISGMLAQTKRMLVEKCEELGIDPFSVSPEENAGIHQREKAFVDCDELSQLGDCYSRAAKEVLEDLSVLDRDQYEPPLAILGWYLFFIPVHIKCSLHALLDEDGFENRSQYADSTSHANGTVKITLIAIDRSLTSWKQLAELSCPKEVERLIELLESIRAKLERRFPLARDFIRPGFDEVETVM